MMIKWGQWQKQKILFFLTLDIIDILWSATLLIFLGKYNDI